MIQIAEGNILRADAEALVNTVNCVGFMGKGGCPPGLAGETCGEDDAR